MPSAIRRPRRSTRRRTATIRPRFLSPILIRTACCNPPGTRSAWRRESGRRSPFSLPAPLPPAIRSITRWKFKGSSRPVFVISAGTLDSHSDHLLQSGVNIDQLNPSYYSHGCVGSLAGRRQPSLWQRRRGHSRHGKGEPGPVAAAVSAVHFGIGVQREHGGGSLLLLLLQGRAPLLERAEHSRVLHVVAQQG